VKAQMIFRPLTIADAQRLFEIYSDKEAMKYRGSMPLEQIKDAQAYIRDQELKRGSVLTVREGVVLSDSQTLIGSVMYRYDESKPGECEIGYSIGRRFWGQGYGHAILKQMLSVLQDRKNIEHIKAECHKENIASIKVLAKAGFECIQSDETTVIHIYGKSMIYKSQISKLKN